MAELDPTLTLFKVGSLTDQLALPLFPARMAAIVLGAVGLLAVVLAATSVFALVACAVSRRTREIGIRMAPGARRGEVLILILRRTAMVGFIGAATGAVLALGAAPIFGYVLHGVNPRDPAKYAFGLLLMSGIIAAACWYPARRAMGIDPARTLREE